MREERRLLKGQAHVPFFRRAMHSASGRDQGLAQIHPPLRRFLQAGGNAKQRGFAAARRPQQTDHFAGPQVQIDVLQDGLAVYVTAHPIHQQMRRLGISLGDRVHGTAWLIGTHNPTFYIHRSRFRIPR